MELKISLPDAIATFLKENPEAGRSVIAAKFNIGDKTARQYAAIGKMIQEYDQIGEIINTAELEKCKVSTEYEAGKGGSITVTGLDLSDRFSEEGAIERALRVSKINRKEWIPGKIKIGHWDTSLKLRKRTGEKSHEYEDKPYPITHWSVSIELTPNKLKHYEGAFENIVEKMKPILTAPAIIKKPEREDLCGLLEPADAHIAKHAWSKETLGGDMDLPISIQKFKYGCESDLNKMAMHDLSKMFIVLGHDLTHIDNKSGETEKGHHQLDYDSRFIKIIEDTEMALISIIDQAVQIAPTEVIWVPGNHDFHASFHLCRSMMHRYSNFKHVTFNIGPSPRKMIVWGDNLIGLCHDAEGRKKIPTVNLLAQYDPWKSYWSRARWTELHTGHLHKRETMTIGGTLWRRIACLSTVDEWHTDGVFTDAVPCCQSFVYHKKEGIYAEYPTNISYLE